MRGNHENCNCTYLSDEVVDFKGEKVPCETWETPEGSKYARVFKDEKSREYYKVWL